VSEDSPPPCLPPAIPATESPPGPAAEEPASPAPEADTPAPEVGTPARRPLPGAALVHALVAVAYAAVTVVIYWPVGFLDGSRLTYTGDDVAEYVWDLAWLPHALFHGHDPFVANSINYPFGANMASNTLAPLLGLVASPLTLSAGPLPTYNLLMRLAFVCSGLAMYFVLGRYLRSRLACFLGGLLYAFSPYMISEGHDHLGLVFVPFPPLIFFLLDRIVTGEGRDARRLGLWLGLIAGGELLVSAEVLAGVALLCLLALVALVARYPRQVRGRLRRVVRGLCWAVPPFALLGGWQTWAMLAGPQRVVHNPAPYEIAQFREDLLSLIIPTSNQAVGPASLIARGSSFVSTDFIENGLYLGIPLLAVFLVLAVTARRRRLVGMAAFLAFAAFVFSLGSPLNVNGHVTRITLPFALFPHLPLFEDEAASRYSLFVQLFVALVVAVGVDEVIGRWRARAEGRRADWRLLALGAALVVALVPIIPRIPYPSFATAPDELPAYFTQGGAVAIPSGSVVLTYPLPVWPYNEALLWQAETRLRFTIVSGPWNEPQDPPNTPEGTPPLLHPDIIQVLFTEALYGQPASVLFGPPAAGATLPPNDAATRAEIRAFLRNYKVDAILVDPMGVNPALATSYLTAALGHGPYYLGGMQVYYDVQASLSGQ